MAAKKLGLSACEQPATLRILRIDDPRVGPMDTQWTYSLHDGTLFGGHLELSTQKARLSLLPNGGARRDFEVPPFLVDRQTRVHRDATRAIGIEDKKTLHEIDLRDGSIRSVYSAEGLTAVDYLTADLVVAMIEKSVIVLARGADGRFVERASTSHTGFNVAAFEERYVVSRAEKTVRFMAFVNDELVNLGSVGMKYANMGEIMQDGRPTVVMSEKDSWFFVDGLAEAFEAVNAPKPKKAAKPSKGPLKLALERSDAGPDRPALGSGEQLVGVTAKGRAIVLSGSRITARAANGESLELASYEPGIQIYTASVHPSEERLLLGAAPVFPAPLVELSVDTKHEDALGIEAQRASYLGNDHVVVLEYQTKRLTLRPRAMPLGAPVFEMETQAASLTADAASGWLLLTGMGVMEGKPRTELHRLVVDADGARLALVAELAPKSKRLQMPFVHELVVRGDVLYLRSFADWYAVKVS